MTDWRNGRWAAFDTETTGVNPAADRIVTAAIIVTDRTPVDILINPGIDIPAEATAVHGIATAHARANGMEPARGVELLTDTIRDLWAQGIPLVVYNAPYDLTLLDAESRRHLGRPLEIKGPIIDPLVIDKAVDQYRRGSRKLLDTCRHYGITLDESAAHGALADATASLHLAQRMLSDWGQADLRQLYRDQRQWYRQQRESFAAYLSRQGKQLDDPSTEWPIRELGGAA